MLEILGSFPLGILGKSHNTITRSKKTLRKINVIEGTKMEMQKYNLFYGSKVNLFLPNYANLMTKGVLGMKMQARQQLTSRCGGAAMQLESRDAMGIRWSVEVGMIC